MENLVLIGARISFAENQGTQAAEFVAVLVTELLKPAGGLRIEFRLNRLQQLQALSGNTGDGLTLIASAACAPHQSTGLQAVDQAGDIGSALDHAAGDFTAGTTVGMYPAQDAQHVILRTS